MSKIGLCIQFEGINNYGTVLQAYATKYTVDSLKYSSKLIRYRRDYSVKFILSQIPRLFERGNLKGMLRNNKRKHDLEDSSVFREYMETSKISFSEFRNTYFPKELIDEYVGFKNLKKNSINYDAFIVGSDQLWLPAGLRTNFYNLNFVNKSVKKISYATSFGVSEIPKNHFKATRDYLKRIDYLSVREIAGQRIIKDLTGRDAYLACDPVLLLTEQEWSQFCDRVEKIDNVQSGKYLLCYFLGGSEDARCAAEKIAKNNNLKLVAIKYMEDYFVADDSFGEICPKGISPEQFVYLIKNAGCVMTDSFHGLVFSVIFNKPFLTTYRFSNQSKMSKNSRIDSILAKFGLSDRLYTDGDPVEQMLSQIDYNKVNEIKGQWRLESIDFLKKALED
ncbi:MAG: polysaccharide pyruvyl transferase family protein [Sedimentibacter saalensis]|uniref:polysaccharide pyruvyl transferase family protein n=1 Tax=Sedimentibacter saalensis TaxID=130788 RepID=UPI002B202BC9|nr:polysaccharide pyruvyl transferase family protein [Sedimentibacter saalensis]MEA5093493.1 polysaccharide pyruvyl transferase family protein [Sedimentibacter saalensis]